MDPEKVDMKKILVVIPKMLSSGVISSQVLYKFKEHSNACYWFRGKHDFSDHVYSPSHKIVMTKSELIKELKNSDTVYTRSVFDFLYIFMLVKLHRMPIKTIMDVRGLIPEESKLRHNSKIRYFILYNLLKISVRLADSVETVSANMKVFLESEYSITVEKVTPCFVSKEKVVHKKLLKNHKSTPKIYRFIYVGSMGKWQSFDKVCKLISEFNAPYSFTVVTRQLEEAKKVISQSNINATLVSGNWSLVESYLDEADFGFVYREKNVVNTTASPIKLLEYAGRGVIPIMTKWVGDYSNEFKDCSYVLSDGENLHKELLDKMLNQKTLDLLYEKSLCYSW